MKFREPNQVLWRGVRPAHNGEQVRRMYTIEDAIYNLYTVPDDQTLYLCHSQMNIRQVADGEAFFAIYDPVPSWWYMMHRTEVLVGAVVSPSIASYWPPIEVPEKYILRIHSSAAGLKVEGCFFGWRSAGR